MIHLSSIHLRDFKGIKDFACDFEDLTILAGLNNSGKTSLLEAIHILTESLSDIVKHPSALAGSRERHVIDVQRHIRSLGLPEPAWLLPFSNWDASFSIQGTFSVGIAVEIACAGQNRFVFDLTPSDSEVSEAERQQRVQALGALASELILPPGIVSSREAMVTGPQYDNEVRAGKGAQLWRNSIFWAVQDGGFEEFEPIRKLVRKHFPDVEVSVPVLDRSASPPGISFRYSEGGKGRLDISQSGGGLRTFLTLARLLEQSQAQVLLLDEPDSHLHASQQAAVMDLLVDVASNGERQVVLATHSPELLSRAPFECVRWIEPHVAQPVVASTTAAYLERLGVAADTFVSASDFPNVIVYVEGKKDRPLIESLVGWYRNQDKGDLPSVLVVPHRDGRFDAVALQALSRFVKEMHSTTRIVGIRDLDWYYDQWPDWDYNTLPGPDPNYKKDDGWILLTLPCKELENLLCDVDVLFHAYEGEITKEDLARFIDEESNERELVDCWGDQLRPRIRDRMDAAIDPSTKEGKAREIFDTWRANAADRSRYVGGKRLLARIRERISKEKQLTCYPSQMFQHLTCLPATWQKIAQVIFADIN